MNGERIQQIGSQIIVRLFEFRFVLNNVNAHKTEDKFNRIINKRMATYKSDVVTIHSSAENVFSKLNNLEGLSGMIKNAPTDVMPEDKRVLLDSISVTADSISFPAGQFGSLTLKKTESEAPRLIKLTGEGTPVPMSMSLMIQPLGSEECEATVEIDLQVPMMLKPMINGSMKKMTGEFAQMLRTIKF